MSGPLLVILDASNSKLTEKTVKKLAKKVVLCFNIVENMFYNVFDAYQLSPSTFVLH